MNENYLLNQIENCRLFCGLNEDQLISVLSFCTEQTFFRGEIIRSADKPMNMLAIIISGKAVVRKGSAVISTLGSNDFFGAAQIFGSSNIPPTDIVAKTECHLLCLEKEAITSLISSNGAFAENFIIYLTERIEFLTSRLGTISSGSAADKLVDLLHKSGNLSTDCSNMSILAKKLNVGRASLYRAVDLLIKEGKIEKSNTTIKLLEVTK